MFRLELSLEDWKRKLISSNSLTKSDIDELESHLLDEIESLIKKDLTEEEAFCVACSRIGSVDLLSDEFSKINFNIIWLKKILWLLSGYILISFSNNLVNSLSAFVTTSVLRFTSLTSNAISGLSFILNIIFSIILLCLLFMPRYMLISKIQSKFNYLFAYKKWLLILLFSLFTIINTIGFNYLNYILAMELQSSLYGNIMIGESIFFLIWSIAICVLFIFLLRKAYKPESKSV